MLLGTIMIYRRQEHKDAPEMMELNETVKFKEDKDVPDSHTISTSIEESIATIKRETIAEM